jgi:hypothetical protein
MPNFSGRKQSNVNLFEPQTGSVLVQVLSAVQCIIIQRIRYYPTTYVAGTVLNFLDSLTSQVIGAMTIVPPGSAPGSDGYVIEFDDRDGYPLSTGANLVLSVLSGGVTGALEVDCFQLPLHVVVPYVAPQTAGFTA